MMNWLVVNWPHASLNSDLCAFFYLRAASLLRTNGELGFLATKTIGEGDTARTGLAFLMDNYNINIRYAKSSFTWPGTASVTAALVIACMGEWDGLKYLDERPVAIISPNLDDQEGWGEAVLLVENKTRSFQGSVLAGKGFILTTEEASEFIKKNHNNKRALFPFLSGEDINSHPEHKTDRWVIDFRDLSLVECQKQWPELVERLLILVKPIREKVRREAHRKYWWHHGDKRPALYKKIKNKEEVFVISRVTKYLAITLVPAKQVFGDAVCIFDLPSWASFAALQCTFHEIWVRRESSTMGERIRYTPSDSFDTYPFLHLKNDQLESVGKNIMIFERR